MMKETQSRQVSTPLRTLFEIFGPVAAIGLVGIGLSLLGIQAEPTLLGRGGEPPKTCDYIRPDLKDACNKGTFKIAPDLR
jgi:hypothetical protein